MSFDPEDTQLDVSIRDLLKMIYVELKKMNFQLETITDQHVVDKDVVET